MVKTIEPNFTSCGFSLIFSTIISVRSSLKIAKHQHQLFNLAQASIPQIE